MLADTLLRLIEIDDDIKLPAKQEGHEFGYVPFEQLPPAQVTVTEEVIINEVNDMKVKIQHTDPVQKDLKIELPISNYPMEISMKNFDFRLSSTYTANNALISHLQIDHYTIYKI